MASQTTGIQQLLSAEKKASEKIMDAKKRKAHRIKQARDEASEEVEIYKQGREAKLKALQAQVGSADKGEVCESKLETDTQARIVALEAVVAINKEKVINDILAKVYDIKPELHRNFTKN